MLTANEIQALGQLLSRTPMSLAEQEFVGTILNRELTEIEEWAKQKQAHPSDEPVYVDPDKQ